MLTKLSNDSIHNLKASVIAYSCFENNTMASFEGPSHWRVEKEFMLLETMITVVKNLFHPTFEGAVYTGFDNIIWDGVEGDVFSIFLLFFIKVAVYNPYEASWLMGEF